MFTNNAGVLSVLVCSFRDCVGKQTTLDYSTIARVFYWFRCVRFAIASVSGFRENFARPIAFDGAV